MKTKEEASARRARWYQDNKERIKEQQRVYRRHHRRELTERYRKYYAKHAGKMRAYQKKYYAEHKAERRVWMRKRTSTDINFRLARNLRSRMATAIRRHLKGIKVVSAGRDLGCTMDEFVTHIQLQWLPGMSWSNYGNREWNWSIDHIKPISGFCLSDRSEMLSAVHFSNLRPMWHPDNVRKSNNPA